MSDSAAERLRAALSAAPGDHPLAGLARGSLLGLAERHADLKAVADELAGAVRTELDLHLDGAGVTNHETAASDFGRFVTRTAIAVKEFAKATTGRRQFQTRLQVVGPTAGSVRVLLRSPEARDATEGIPGTQVETVESVALRKLVALMLQAETAEDDEGTPLEASMHGLRGETRRAVRLVGQAVVDGQWRLSGQLRTRGQQATPVRLSEAGAQRLVAAARLTEAEVGVEELPGIVDGWIWSEATMIFQPATGRRFRAAVGEELQSAVSMLGGDPRPEVTARFTVVTTFPPGEERSARRSYSLDAIEAIPEEPTLEVSEN